MISAPILVFDSGLGGLSVYAEIVRALPHEQIVYCADNAGFPYGDWQEDELATRIKNLLAELNQKFQPRAIVIACNTATVIALDLVRAQLDVPIVGTVPAIKVAAEQSVSRMFSVLATPVTIGREYTRDLISKFASSCDVTLVGSANLARLAERYIQDNEVSHEAVLAEIAPAFVETDQGRTDHIVLGCTHFPLLTDIMTKIAPWPVVFIDPAPAIARRLAAVLPEDDKQGSGTPTHIFVSTAPMSKSSLKAVKQMGHFESAEMLRINSV
ncbi:MAG: glutamate racemase [Rhizobiales bacterium]|nr:glutamate racemase [Hyphomicrobiales bacterium]